MSQGRPIHLEEYRFIWATKNQFPSLVARQLAISYSHLNGGFRGRETVADIQREMQNYTTFQEWWESHNIKQEKPINRPDARKRKKVNK